MIKLFFGKMNRAAAILLFLGGAALAQSPPKSPPPKSVPPPVRPEVFGTYEKAISAVPGVSVKLCVAQGEVKINGWGREEVRVFVRSGRDPFFKILERDADSNKAAWLFIGNSPASDPGASECLTGETIELDLPFGATLDISGRTAGVAVESIRRAKAKIVEGSVRLRNVSGGVTAEVFQGDVFVESCLGPISLQAGAGNITAFDLKPGEIGDGFRARTNSGTISMQGVKHRQIDAGSIFGSVIFEGSFLPGGIYDFKTTNGKVRLLLPADSNGKIIAAYGFGTFQSAIPYKVLADNNTTGGKSIVAQIGNGNATVNVTTASGSIVIERAQ
ncbi:MAG: DUF4097 family beta strand repeat-containing protein [Pyrinomonadaceae bacterium]|jgi:hypothetical protein